MKHFILSVSALAVMGGVPTIAHAQLGDGTVAEARMSQTGMSQTGAFTKKRYNVKGGWEIVEMDGKTVIKFSDKFKTKNGPDLKVFLSPKSVSGLTGETATMDAVNIGVLKSNKGSQFYTLPEGINLADYSSVLIHCEAYSVLWGGFDIPG